MTTEDDDPVAELAGEIQGLRRLPPLERAQRARSLIDQAKRVLSEAGDAAVVAAVMTSSQAHVARRLGVGTSAVHKAVVRHRARLREADVAEAEAAGVVIE